MIKTVFGINQ